MELKDWLNLVALAISPLLAVQATEWLRAGKARLDRKRAIFHSLMATRASSMRGLVSAEQVRALNMIDIEFHGDAKAKKLLDAWKAHFEHLNQDPHPMSEAAETVWASKRDDLYVELLFEMGTYLGYDFDRTLLRRVAYFPQGFADGEHQAQKTRAAALAVLEGRQPIAMVSLTGPLRPHGTQVPPAAVQATPAPDSTSAASMPGSPAEK